MNYRTFLDTPGALPLNEIYKILTKKYYKGRDNRTIHYKLAAKLLVLRHDCGSDWSKFWTRQPQKDGVFGVNMYADIYVASEGHLYMTIDKNAIKLHTFDIKDEGLISRDHCVISMDDFNKHGTITEDIFFQISTVMNLHGLTYSECVTIQKIWNTLLYPKM